MYLWYVVSPYSVGCPWPSRSACLSLPSAGIKGLRQFAPAFASPVLELKANTLSFLGLFLAMWKCSAKIVNDKNPLGPSAFLPECWFLSCCRYPSSCRQGHSPPVSSEDKNTPNYNRWQLSFGTWQCSRCFILCYSWLKRKTVVPLPIFEMQKTLHLFCDKLVSWVILFILKHRVALNSSSFCWVLRLQVCYHILLCFPFNKTFTVFIFFIFLK